MAGCEGTIRPRQSPPRRMRCAHEQSRPRTPNLQKSVGARGDWWVKVVMGYGGGLTRGRWDCRLDLLGSCISRKMFMLRCARWSSEMEYGAAAPTRGHDTVMSVTPTRGHDTVMSVTSDLLYDYTSTTPCKATPTVPLINLPFSSLSPSSPTTPERHLLCQTTSW